MDAPLKAPKLPNRGGPWGVRHTVQPAACHFQILLFFGGKSFKWIGSSSLLLCGAFFYSGLHLRKQISFLQSTFWIWLNNNPGCADTLVSGWGVTETGLGSHRGGTASYIHLIQATGGLYHLCTHKKVMEFSLTLGLFLGQFDHLWSTQMICLQSRNKTGNRDCQLQYTRGQWANMVDALVDYDDNRFRLLYLVVTLADYDHNRGCRIDSEGNQDCDFFLC